jgi:hypothetical protein
MIAHEDLVRTFRADEAMRGGEHRPGIDEGTSAHKDSVARNCNHPRPGLRWSVHARYDTSGWSPGTQPTHSNSAHKNADAVRLAHNHLCTGARPPQQLWWEKTPGWNLNCLSTQGSPANLGITSTRTISRPRGRKIDLVAGPGSGPSEPYEEHQKSGAHLLSFFPRGIKGPRHPVKRVGFLVGPSGGHFVRSEHIWVLRQGSGSLITA